MTAPRLTSSAEQLFLMALLTGAGLASLLLSNSLQKPLGFHWNLCTPIPARYLARRQGQCWMFPDCLRLPSSLTSAITGADDVKRTCASLQLSFRARPNIVKVQRQVLPGAFCSVLFMCPDGNVQRVLLVRSDNA